jgi:hypothetical protein
LRLPADPCHGLKLRTRIDTAATITAANRSTDGGGGGDKSRRTNDDDDDDDDGGGGDAYGVRYDWHALARAYVRTGGSDHARFLHLLRVLPCLALPSLPNTLLFLLFSWRSRL